MSTNVKNDVCSGALKPTVFLGSNRDASPLRETLSGQRIGEEGRDEARDDAHLQPKGRQLCGESHDTEIYDTERCISSWWKTFYSHLKASHNIWNPHQTYMKIMKTRVWTSPSTVRRTSNDQKHIWETVIWCLTSVFPMFYFMSCKKSS